MRHKILVILLLLGACAPKPRVDWDHLTYEPAQDIRKLDMKGGL